MFNVPIVEADQYDRRNMMRVHRRKLRDSTNPFEIPEARFIELYRLKKAAAKVLLNDISPFMKKGVKTTFIPQHIRMCTALHFLLPVLFIEI
ncbi:hypothetical protein CVS40_7180 [Lucilia cuprina]|nr:hypothetical protein CVS40_7180 [Lucilia cuprina]